MRKEDIERVSRDVADKARRLGLNEPGKAFVLNEGSPANGIPWSVGYLWDEGPNAGYKVGGVVPHIPDNGSLGFNKRGAYETLRTVNTALGAVLYAQRQEALAIAEDVEQQ